MAQGAYKCQVLPHQSTIVFNCVNFLSQLSHGSPLMAPCADPVTWLV